MNQINCAGFFGTDFKNPWPMGNLVIGPCSAAVSLFLAHTYSSRGRRVLAVWAVTELQSRGNEYKWGHFGEMKGKWLGAEEAGNTEAAPDAEL